MSRQAKKPRLAIVPDQVSAAPGADEAQEIRRLYATAQQGIRAFVLMGFRLIEVKASLPHGHYMPWMEKHLGDLGYRHLHHSKQIAETIALRLGWSNVNCGSYLQTLPPEVCDLIDGKGYRTLLMELREPLDEDAAAKEEKHRVECEKMWQHSPEDRDEWEPRVLAGEITYYRALTGMLGHKLTQGKTKPAEDHGALIKVAVERMHKHFQHFETLSPLMQASVVDKFRLLAEAVPESCRKAALEIWKGGRA